MWEKDKDNRKIDIDFEKYLKNLWNIFQYLNTFLNFNKKFHLERKYISKGMWKNLK